MKREIETALGRRAGPSRETKEYIDQQTAPLEWYAFKRSDAKEGRNPIRGTLKEIREETRSDGR